MGKENFDNTQKGILALNANLADLQFPMACIFNAVSEYNFGRVEKNYSEEAQERATLMKYAVLVIYQFAFFESAIDWKTWKKYEGEYLVKRLISYRHIRHAFAHSFNGKRVHREGNARDIENEMFDLIMKSADPLKGVKIDSEDCISINYDSIMELNTLLRSVSTIHICKTRTSYK